MIDETLSQVSVRTRSQASLQHILRSTLLVIALLEALVALGARALRLSDLRARHAPELERAEEFLGRRCARGRAGGARRGGRRVRAQPRNGAIRGPCQRPSAAASGSPRRSQSRASKHTQAANAWHTRARTQRAEGASDPAGTPKTAERTASDALAASHMSQGVGLSLRASPIRPGP